MTKPIRLDSRAGRRCRYLRWHLASHRLWEDLSSIVRGAQSVPRSKAKAKATREVPWHALDLVTGDLRVGLDDGCA